MITAPRNARLAIGGLVLLAAGGGGASLHGETAYPMLMSLRPVAIQCGSSAEIEVKSRYTMLGAYEVLLSGEGVTAEVLPVDVKQTDPAKKPVVDKLKLKLTAASDADPGVRDVRLATPQGVSTVAQLVVVRNPVIAESQANESPAQAQEIAWPAAICGSIDRAEDVDFYRFRASAGDALVFQVRCARLQDRIHDLQTHTDPILTLRAPSGAVLAIADNDIYYADPLLAHTFQQAGDYLLEIRDVRYQGNQYWEYCLEIHNSPVAIAAHPLAVAAGQECSLLPLGHLLNDQRPLPWSVPTSLTPGIHRLRLPLETEPSNPVPVIVTDLPLVQEVDSPNDDPKQAQEVTLPACINGRMERAADLDHYRFTASKGDSFVFEVLARRVQSALDSHLRILDASGKQLAINDDLRLGRRTFTDSAIENWNAPADGQYVVEVRDVNLRGGDLFPYSLKVSRSQPSFDLYLDSDKTQVPSGGTAAIFVRAERKNGFAGEIQLEIAGLPPTIQASCGRILADKGQDGCILLTAASAAPLSVSNVTVKGTAIHPSPGGEPLHLSATAVPYQEIYQPGGGRGHWPVTSHAVAISKPADIRSITLSTYDITLKPGESKRIDIKFDRAPEFTANVTLDMLMRHLNTTYANTLPPGVTLNDKDAKSLLSGTANDGFLTLTAAKDAPPTDRQQAVVLAHVALNFVMKWTYASQPLTISISSTEK